MKAKAREDAGRTRCEIVGCGRTRRRINGPIAWQQWLCTDHYKLVPARMKRVLQRIHRAIQQKGWAHRPGLNRIEHRIWRRCVRAAQHRAVGL